MGISSASEIFTETIRSLLADCPGQLNMTDDVLVYGDTEEEHQTNLMRVLARLEECGITLNMDKCAFYRNEVTFFGLSSARPASRPHTTAAAHCARPRRRATPRSCAVCSAQLNSALVSSPTWRRSLSHFGA